MRPMKRETSAITRREWLRTAGAMAACAPFSRTLCAAGAEAAAEAAVTRAIPSSGERIALVGLGTSGTFSRVEGDEQRARLTEVLQVFFDRGGQLIDSSPMYGDAESVLGELLPRVQNRQGLFAATKVWTRGREAGIEQMQRSMQCMGVATMDLMQVHNLVDWKTHLATLREWKEQGKIRYLGITTSHGRSHEEFERILRSEPLDFVQFSYNVVDRTAEQRLLPLSAERGVATLINRPYQRGSLFRAVRGKALPEWAAEFDCASWGQFFLKFIGGHPDVTCIIPATSKAKHAKDNMGGGYGRLPDAATRKRMIAYVEAL